MFERIFSHFEFKALLHSIITSYNADLMLNAHNGYAFLTQIGNTIFLKASIDDCFDIFVHIIIVGVSAEIEVGWIFGQMP